MPNRLKRFSKSAVFPFKELLLFSIVLRGLRRLTQEQEFVWYIDLHQVVENKIWIFWPSFIEIQLSIWMLCPKMWIFGPFRPTNPCNPTNTFIRDEKSVLKIPQMILRLVSIHN